MISAAANKQTEIVALLKGGRFAFVGVRRAVMTTHGIRAGMAVYVDMFSADDVTPRGIAAEFIGTLLVVFTGCLAATSESAGLAAIAFAFGLATMVLMFCTADLSGRWRSCVIVCGYQPASVALRDICSAACRCQRHRWEPEPRCFFQPAGHLPGAPLSSFVDRPRHYDIVIVATDVGAEIRCVRNRSDRWRRRGGIPRSSREARRVRSASIVLTLPACCVIDAAAGCSVDGGHTAQNGAQTFPHIAAWQACIIEVLKSRPFLHFERSARALA